MTELDLYRVDVPEDRQRKVYTRLVDATFEVIIMCGDKLITIGSLVSLQQEVYA